MRRQLVVRRQWWLAALACVGVAVTHALAYPLAQSDAHLRGELLHETGHDVWPSFMGVVIVGALVVVLAASVTRHAASGSQRVRATATRLAVLQGTAWLLVETVERASSGHAHMSVRTLAPVVIGLVVQVVVAIVAALLLSLLARALEAWQARRRARWGRRPVVLLPSWLAVALPRVATSPAAPRGPPAL